MKKTTILFLQLFVLWSYSGKAQTPKTDILYGGFQSSLISPRHIIKVSDNHYFIDFGKDAFGTVVLTLKSKQKDTLIIHLGEKTINTNTIDRNPGGSIRYQKIRLTNIPVGKAYRVMLPADKRNTGSAAVKLPDSLGVITPFRYCEIENLTVPLSDITIHQKMYNYRFNDQSSAFTCSDTILNQIWDMCKYTIKATSFCGLYVDGDRERIPYEADAYINQLSHYCVDNEYSIARNTNEYFIEHPTWPTEWLLHTVLLFYNDYQYTGNLASISKYYDALKTKTLIDIEREDGLISSKSPLLTKELKIKLGETHEIRDIVDWPTGERDGYEMVDVNTVVNAFHYINLKLMAEIAGYMGKKEDSLLFYKKSILVKNTINQKLFDKTKGLYVDGENSKHSSLHGNMFPLVFGLVPEENLKTVVAFVKSRGMACSVYGAQYLLEALYQQGEADYAFSLMTATNDRGWWNMIKSGSTIALEAWDKKYKPNLDWNHAWGTTPANIVTRNMWGIIPATPGFVKVQIKPQLGPLTSSKIMAPTIRGAINAEFTAVDNKHQLYVVELPLGMNGDFVLTNDAKARIMVNKKPVNAIGGIVPIHSGINRIEIIY